MSYTAWSADGRSVVHLDSLPAHRIYDDETENAGPSLPAGRVEHSAVYPPARSAPTPIHDENLPETRGRGNKPSSRPRSFSEVRDA